MDFVSAKIRKTTFNRFKQVCTDHSISMPNLLDIASLALSQGIIDIAAIKTYIEKISEKSVEVALTKEQSIKKDSQQYEVAGCSYDRTGNPSRPIVSKSYSVMPEKIKLGDAL